MLTGMGGAYLLHHFTVASSVLEAKTHQRRRMISLA